MNRAPLRLLVLFLWLVATGTARAGENVQVLSVTPGTKGESLVCRIETEGLPTEKAIRSLGGGLPSAVDVILELVDEEEKVVVRRRLTFRVAYDLWEEIYRVEAGETHRSMNVLDEVRAYLAELRELPIVPLASLAGIDSCRIRAGLVSHAIAPAEKSRFGDWIAGDGAGTGADAEGREVTLGLGHLIRFVFGGSGDGGPPAGVGESAWFRPSALRGEEEPDA